MAVRAPHLHLTLRSFCLGAFVFLGRALEEGDDLPFAFEEHVQRGGPALYEYRPLVRTFVESRASALEGREDARDRKSTRLNSSHSQISYAVFCLKKKNIRSKHSKF